MPWSFSVNKCKFLVVIIYFPLTHTLLMFLYTFYVYFLLCNRFCNTVPYSVLTCSSYFSFSLCPFHYCYYCTSRHRRRHRRRHRTGRRRSSPFHRLCTFSELLTHRAVSEENGDVGNCSIASGLICRRLFVPPT